MNTVELIGKYIEEGQEGLFSQHCDIHPNTIERWKTSGTIELKGSALIKVQEYLTSRGQQPQDVKNLPYPIPELRRMVAKTPLSGQRVLTQLAGYSDNSDFYRILQGHHGPSEECRQRMVNLAENPDLLTASQDSKAAIEGPRSTSDTMLDTLRLIIEAAVPLAEFAVSGNISANQRANFRGSFRGNTLHRFNDMITALLSEQSRRKVAEAYQESGKQLNKSEEQ